jgi:hypothetical protein
MSAIASQFAAGIDQAMSSLAVTGTYTRSDTGATLSLQVALAAPQYATLTDPGVMIVSADSWEVLIRTADLVFSGQSYEPRIGDTITVVTGAITRIYATLLPTGERNCWAWADRFKVRRKLFTKLTSTS